MLLGNRYNRQFGTESDADAGSNERRYLNRGKAGNILFLKPIGDTTIKTIEIAECLGIHYATASRQIKKIESSLNVWLQDVTQYCERTGRPLGKEGFVAKLEKALGRMLHRRKPGHKRRTNIELNMVSPELHQKFHPRCQDSERKYRGIKLVYNAMSITRDDNKQGFARNPAGLLPTFLPSMLHLYRATDCQSCLAELYFMRGLCSDTLQRATAFG